MRSPTPAAPPRSPGVGAKFEGRNWAFPGSRGGAEPERPALLQVRRWQGEGKRAGLCREVRGKGCMSLLPRRGPGRKGLGGGR